MAGNEKQSPPRVRACTSAALVLWLALAVSCGTGSSVRPADVRRADVTIASTTANDAGHWVVLQVSRVQVAPKRIDNSTWDGEQEKEANGCGIVGMIGKSAGGPVGGAVATFLCERSGNKQAQRDPRAPDLFVQVTAGALKYRTSIAVDTYGEAFDYPIVVPVDGLGPTGLEIQVLDQDEDVGSGELIGMVRVSASDLASARRATPPLLTRKDGQLERIELAVLPYEPPVSQQPIEFDVRQSAIALKARARAGEIVRVKASGAYSVANNGETITEEGYANGEKRNYNLKDFAKANHAAAIARIGPPDETHTSLVVGRCVVVLSPIAGQISIGINDDATTNNEGSITFDVEVGLPTLDEWKTGESRACDGGPTSSEARQGVE